ncbi:Sprouty-related, EVH1 domain-containing protein 2 [Trachymyrmex septentrionalis]|uniref:Sprouty-related, EVH1 domain-containing protein 2 n=1 Tax=Trachymyrmex septentrionalis TaxID=34720 RepID=A0A195FT87_9HYME|nr:Sprouty-related, EVH1 domain-containing protein 2 [Trachymyrmex septentrionalis]
MVKCGREWALSEGFDTSNHDRDVGRVKIYKLLIQYYIRISLNIGNYLVRVHAQVMTRDDSSGGWVPLSGGGLANVSVRPIGLQNHGSSNMSPPSMNKKKHEYLIYGKRITDQSVVLSCTIKKDFEYNKVMPTFHHWRTGEKKFGLTFQTAADARAFDKGVRTAVEELLEGLSDLTLTTDIPDAGDEDVFMTLNLPVEPPEPRLSSDTSLGIRMSSYSQYSELPDPHRSIHYISNSSTIKAPSSQHPLASTTDIGSDNYPYVQLTTLNHEYLYPIIDDHKGERLDGHNISNSESSLKKPDTIISQPSKNTVKRNVQTLRCKHCQELYSEQHNPKGSCEYAPDPIRRGIATISCLSCAQCMLYHCMSDAEGDFAQNPCSCSAEEGCGRRWLGLALLSLIVPCLWIYPPLKAVHWCGMFCGMCGGRHHPME